MYNAVTNVTYLKNNFVCVSYITIKVYISIFITHVAYASYNIRCVYSISCACITFPKVLHVRGISNPNYNKITHIVDNLVCLY